MNIFETLRHRRQTAFISVDPHHCKACWACYNACPRQVFGKVDLLGHRHIKVRQADRCIGCKKCVDACRFMAITALKK